MRGTRADAWALVTPDHSEAGEWRVMSKMTADRSRLEAVLHAGIQNAGVSLDGAELAQLKSLTAAMLDGLDRLDQLGIQPDQTEPAVVLSLQDSKDRE